MSRGHKTRKSASMPMGLFGNRTGLRWLAAWVAATVVGSVAAEAPAQRQSPSAESKASAVGAEPPGRAADASQRHKHRGIKGHWIDPGTILTLHLTPEVPGTPWTHSWQRL